MNIVMKKITELSIYENNPRNNEEEVQVVANSIWNRNPLSQCWYVFLFCFIGRCHRQPIQNFRTRFSSSANFNSR